VEFNRCTLPNVNDWSQCLSWIRRQLNEIVQKYDPQGACLKGIEPLSKNKSTKRIQIEAIIQEYLYSNCSLSSIVRVKSQLKKDIVDFNEPARYLERIFQYNDALMKLDSPQYQDATLAAIAELPPE